MRKLDIFLKQFCETYKLDEKYFNENVSDIDVQEFKLMKEFIYSNKSILEEYKKYLKTKKVKDFSKFVMDYYSEPTNKISEATTFQNNFRSLSNIQKTNSINTTNNKLNTVITPSNTSSSTNKTGIDTSTTSDKLLKNKDNKKVEKTDEDDIANMLDFLKTNPNALKDYQEYMKKKKLEIMQKKTELDKLANKFKDVKI